MNIISVTFEVLKLDKSNEINEEQPWNINPILFTFEVLKFDKFNEINEEQPWNILYIESNELFHINLILFIIFSFFSWEDILISWHIFMLIKFSFKYTLSGHLL